MCSTARSSPSTRTGGPSSATCCSVGGSRSTWRSTCWSWTARMRALPLKERKALLAKIVRRYGMQKSEPMLDDGKAAFQAVCDLDLEGIVAKRLNDAYARSEERRVG